MQDITGTGGRWVGARVAPRHGEIMQGPVWEGKQLEPHF